MGEFEHGNAQPTPHGLEYANRLQARARTSKLAVLALVASILACPQFLVSLHKRFDEFGAHGYFGFRTRIAVMTCATALAVVAIARIRISRGALLGEGIAWAGLAVSLLWWALMALVFAMLMSWGGPQ